MAEELGRQVCPKGLMVSPRPPTGVQREAGWEGATLNQI